MTRGNGIATTWPDLLVLLATFAVGMTVAVRFFRWDAGMPAAPNVVGSTSPPRGERCGTALAALAAVGTTSR
jgi:hypothetical protein